jgi:antitoxin HigA-1
MSKMHNPAHPGEVLREYLPASISVTQAAEKLGVSRQAFSNVLNSKAGISAEMAYRLAFALGTTPEFWLKLQVTYDLWAVKQAGLPTVEKLAA